MRPQHPPEEGVATPEGPAPALLVAAPELLVGPHPLDRPTPDPPQLQPERQVEPHDRVGRSDHEVAELALVVAVDHPPVEGSDRLGDARAELLVARLLPAR